MKNLILVLLSAFLGYNIYLIPVSNNSINLILLLSCIIISACAIYCNIRYKAVQKEVFNQKNRFASILTHDLKTPIIAQMRSLDMLLNNSFGKITPECREILELTKNSCTDIYNMVCAEISSYKFENKEIKLEKNEINFTELVLECCEEMQRPAEEKNIKFVIKAGKKAHMIFGDINYLKPAVLYLIENSISYSFRNSQIEISITGTEKGLTFKILTKSRHIPQKNLKNMLNKYIGQISDYNKIGFRIKLNMCSEVIKAHQGHIIAESFANDENILGFNLPLNSEQQCMH